jgi:hypothetical protein
LDLDETREAAKLGVKSVDDQGNLRTEAEIRKELNERKLDLNTDRELASRKLRRQIKAAGDDKEEVARVLRETLLDPSIPGEEKSRLMQMYKGDTLNSVVRRMRDERNRTDPD